MNSTHHRWVGSASLAAVLLVALFTAVALPASAQTQGQPPKQQTPPPQQPPGQTAPPAAPTAPAAPAISPEEEAVFRALGALPPADVKKHIEMGEDFLRKYPSSVYREQVYSKLTHAYLADNQLDKMIAAGEKALELNPDDVDVLALLGWAMPRQLGANKLDADARLEKSQRYCTRALELFATVQKPAALTDEAFARAKNEKLSMCHSGLGLVSFHKGKLAESVTHFEEANKLAAVPEPTDLYVLGVAYYSLKRFSDAVTVFDQCSNVTWDWQDRCKAQLADAKKQAAAAPAPAKQP